VKILKLKFNLLNKFIAISNNIYEISNLS